MNHSGMNFPWDCFILFICFRRAFGKAFSVTPLSAPVLFQHRILHPFGVRQFWRLFCEEATMANFEQLAARGENVLVNPEGIAGLAKGFDQRYQLQKFSTAFVRVALKYKKPIVPVYAINGEYLNPYAYKIDLINAHAKRYGVPFLSFGLFTPLYFLVPFALYISLPARLRYVLGEALEVRDFLPEARRKVRYEDLDTATIKALCERVRAHMQVELDGAVREHGEVKYGWREFFAKVRAAGWDAWKLLPLTWPFLFLQIERIERADLSWRALWLKVAQVTPILGWPLYLVLMAWPDRSQPAAVSSTKALVPAPDLDLSAHSPMKKAL